MKSTNDNNLDTEDEDETPKKNIKLATFLIGVFWAAGAFSIIFWLPGKKSLKVVIS